MDDLTGGRGGSRRGRGGSTPAPGSVEEQQVLRRSAVMFDLVVGLLRVAEFVAARASQALTQAPAQLSR